MVSDLLNRLVSVAGLTEKQARVYFALGVKPLSPRALGKTTKLTMSSIYEILPELVQLGLAEAAALPGYRVRPAKVYKRASAEKFFRKKVREAEQQLKALEKLWGDLRTIEVARNDWRFFEDPHDIGGAHFGDPR